MWFVLALFLAVLAPLKAWGQAASIVPSCGIQNLAPGQGASLLFIDITGNLCTNAAAGGGGGGGTFNGTVTQGPPGPAWNVQQSGTWTTRIQDSLGGNLTSTSNNLNVNIAASGATVTVAGSGTFTTSDANLTAATALGDALSNPTTTQVGSDLLGWDATAVKWRRVQVVTGTGGLEANLVGNGNIAFVDATHSLYISCGGNPCNAADEAAFTLGTTGFSNIGGYYQTTPTTGPLTTGQGGVVQLTQYRAMMVNLRDSSSNEIGIGGCAGQTPANTSTTPFSLASTTALKLVSKVSAKNVYICGINVGPIAAATNLALIEGTKVTNECDTATAGMAGGTTAGAGWIIGASGGLTYGNGLGIVAKTATTNHDVCLLAGGSGQISGVITWAQF